MRILNINKLSSGTLTYSSQLEKYKFSEAFADNNLTRWGKFAANTGQYLQVSFANATPIYYAMILYTNFGTSASVVLQCSNDNFSTVSASHALTQYGKDWIYRNDAGLSYKYYRLAVTDSSVPYPRLSKVYLGGYTQMPGMSEITQPRKSTAKTEKSDSGQLYGYKVIQMRSYAVTFDLVNQTAKDAIDAWFEAYDKVTPSVCLLHEDSLTINPPLYMAISDDIEWKTVIAASTPQYQLSLKLEECK